MAKVLNKIKAALTVTFAAAVMGAGVTNMIGRTDPAGAADYLEQKGYKIENYEGKAGLWDRAVHRLYTADEFTVSTQNGQKSEVIVGSNMFVKSKTIIIKN